MQAVADKDATISQLQTELRKAKDTEKQALYV